MATDTIPTRSELARLYVAMCSADAAFTAALHAAYGAHAGDVRYMPSKQSDDVRALGDAFRAAADAWIQYGYNASK